MSGPTLGALGGFGALGALGVLRIFGPATNRGGAGGTSLRGRPRRSASTLYARAAGSLGTSTRQTSDHDLQSG